MCGIAGIYNLNNRPVEYSIIRAMIDIIQHRGPDSEGIWIDKNIGLGHKRLAIIDLNRSADQPMHSPNSDIHITFNGEISIVG